MSCLRDVAQRDPLDETSALRLVDALIVRGEIAAAEPIIRDWSKKRPAGQVWLRKYYDAAIARHQEWPPVMAECERAFGRQPDVPPRAFIRADSHPASRRAVRGGPEPRSTASILARFRSLLGARKAPQARDGLCA